MTEKSTEHDLSGSTVIFEGILRELTAIRSELVAALNASRAHLKAVHPNYRNSARNLLCYLSLRRRDLRPLQMRLAAVGLSSLGRAESHVLATVDAILKVAHQMAGHSGLPKFRKVATIDFATGEKLLAGHTEALLGSSNTGRSVRIMVTMPSEAAQDYTLVQDLLHQGMDSMRINCAHDNADLWLKMINHLKRAEQALGKHCRIVMDLGGPKLRTGPIESGPTVLRIHPRRDLYGRVTAPARIWMTAESSPYEPPAPADGCFYLPSHWLAQLRPQDYVRCTDARGAKIKFSIVDINDLGCWAETDKTAYLTPETILRNRKEVKDKKNNETPVGFLTPGKNAIFLKQGDLLIISRDLKPGQSAAFDSAGQVLTPAMIGCTIPEVFDRVASGDSIWFDDGKIGGVVEKIESSHVLVRITHALMEGDKLGGDKGINLPDSNLILPALTTKDIEDLSFIAQHADVVELSFANCAQDVELLQQHLAQLGSKLPAIVLKIETRRGFENLPDMLLAAMKWHCCGVMIARGDLAVECGFERLAEAQEEILWICEAAHVPVIWATQVLESLAKKGIPSRAEITDAAMGHRAECVMLNKGPYALSAVKALDDILRRMQAHQAKKSAMLRELRLAHIPTEAVATAELSNHW